MIKIGASVKIEKISKKKKTNSDNKAGIISNQNMQGTYRPEVVDA